MRTSRWMTCMTLAGVLFGSGVLGNAQNPPPSDVIQHRVANFRKIGKAFKGIRDEVKTQEPSLPSIQESAAQIESLGSQILSWFPPGTAEGKTHAKPAVWTERETFERDQKKFYAEAQKMNQLAQSGDKAAVATQYKVLGGTCKNCHDTFRGKVDDN